MGRTTGSRAWGVRAALAVLAVGCRFDPDDRCGPHQAYDGQRCICSEGYGLVGNRCIACGDNEVGSLAGCSCAPGYTRATPTSACTELDALGQPCQSDSDCQHPVYAYCYLGDGDGYCTRRDCEDSSVCETSIDYACNTRETPSFCQRAPAGLGTPCSGSSECTGEGAPYCEVLSAKVCLPNGCKQEPDRCHGDWVCCDIAILRESLCIPPGELESGACPAGGTLIARGG